MSSAEWGPLAEVPSHLTSPVGPFSLWCWFGSHRALVGVFYELHQMSLTSFLGHLTLLSVTNSSRILVQSTIFLYYCVKASSHHPLCCEEVLTLV